MKSILYLITCIIFHILYKNHNYQTFCFRNLNTYPTHNYIIKPNILKSVPIYNINSGSTVATNIITSTKEDLLKDTKDWILSKDHDDLISSAHFDRNFTNLFPSRRFSGGGVLLDVKDASIWLGERILFENVSFSVNTGECVGIIGNNGVGKSSMFDAIYDRICGVNTKKESMSIMMDVKFNVKDDDTINNDFSNNSHLFSFISKLMDRGTLSPSEFFQLYEQTSKEEYSVDTLPIYNLSGVGYMRQNYTLDLDHNALVSDLISKVFETYNVCNNAINYVENNLYYFNNLLDDEQCKNIATDILSLYNNEGRLINQRFSDMKILVKKLVSIFGMETVINSRVSSLSGGFKMRLYLFLLLLHSPNLLLLDEPTNNLDTTTVKFLIDVLNYLMKNTKLSALVVSHDTNLLNSICTSTIQMKGDGNISPYKGNFDDFVNKGTNEKNIKNSRIEKLRKNISILSKEINELKNSKKGSLKALKVTISQKEELMNKYQEEMDELIGSPLSKYTKTYNRVLFEDGKSFNSIFQKMLNKNTLLNTGKMLNIDGPLFNILNVTLETDNGKRVFEDLKLSIYPSDRIVLLGENGIGKTTLLKLLFKSQATFRNNPLLNQISSMEKRMLNLEINNSGVKKGTKTWELFEKINQVNREMTNDGSSVYNIDDIEYRILMNEPFNFKLVDSLMTVNDAKLCYYSQNCSNILNYKKTVYTLLKEYVGDEIDINLLTEYMTFFHLREYMDSYVSDLSFGERSRLLLSLLLINKAHFILLDEPTNHLDLFMKKLLKLIVNTIYKGGFIIATHDLEFIEDLSSVNSFLYIYSKDKVFKFNENFGKEYLKFKSEYPDADRRKILEFLNQSSENEKYSEIKPSTYSEELITQKKVFKKKIKIHPPRSPNDRSRFKNIKRWN